MSRYDGGATLPAPSSRGVAPPASARRQRLLVPSPVVRRAALGGSLAGFATLPFYWDVSLWVGVGIALTVFVVWHGLYAGYEAPWLLGFIAFGGCLQCLLAPWAMYSLQQDSPVPSMVVEPAQYFAFAGPTTLALIGGMYFPLWRARGWPDRAAALARLHVSGDLRRVFSIMLWGGLALRVLVAPLMPASLRYAAYLLSLVSMVGAMCQMLVGVRGWAWRSVLLVFIAAIGNAADLQFLEVLLWALCFGAAIYLRYRPRFWTLGVIAVPAALVFLALSAFKLHSRDELRARFRLFAVKPAADLAAFIDQNELSAVNEQVVWVFLFFRRIFDDGQFHAFGRNAVNNPFFAGEEKPVILCAKTFAILF